MALHGGGHLLCNHQWRPATCFCCYLLQNRCCKKHSQAVINTKDNLKLCVCWWIPTYSFNFFRFLLSQMRTLKGKRQISSHYCLLSLGWFPSSHFSYRCESVSLQKHTLWHDRCSCLLFIFSREASGYLFKDRCVIKSWLHMNQKVHWTSSCWWVIN